MQAPPVVPRRNILLLAALVPVGCGVVTVGGPGGGAGSPNSSGATVAHLQRIVDEALVPKKAELEAKLRAAVLLAAGREGTPMTPGKPTPIGATIDRLRKSGAVVKVEPVLDTGRLDLNVDDLKAKGGPTAFDDRRNVETAFEMLDDFSDRARVEAVLRHLDVLLMMLSWRRDGNALGAEDLEVFRQAQVVARAVDALSALSISAIAMIQAQLQGQAKPAEVDAFFARTADAFPVSGAATAEETRALYDALPGSLEASIDELVRVTRERMPGPFKDTIPQKLGALFRPYVELARQAEGQAGGGPPGSGASGDAAARDAKDAAIREALLAYGSALFPGLGVAIKGYEAAAALLDGKPKQAIELAASMAPGGTVALAVVQESAKVLGVKLPAMG